MHFVERLQQRPLLALTLIALLPRLLAAIFSQGFYAHDDHFLVIEAAGSWVDGSDYNRWLPWNQMTNYPVPSGHSFFYVGFHYLLVLGVKAIGITDPKSIMVLVRLIHAVWSLIVVRIGYRMALHWSNEKVAWRAGLLIALLYFMPFLSVRNLVEVACIPFLMLGAWELVRNEDGPRLGPYLLAGIWIGLAINVRYQVLAFSVGPALVLLWQKEWQRTLAYGLGLLCPFLVFQGGIDLFIWGRPFAEFGEYVRYNLENTTTYFNHPWYQYPMLLAAIFIPPFSAFVLWGATYKWRITAIVLIGVVSFVLVHSLIPNKQERFILPIVPLLFIIGYVGLEELRVKKAWLNRIWKGLLRFTWALNIPALLLITFTYSKRSMVEAVYRLHEVGPLTGIVVDDANDGNPKTIPQFYLNDWAPLRWQHDGKGDLLKRLAETPKALHPDAVIFMDEENLEERWREMENMLGEPLVEIAREQPGTIDRLVHWLNPINRNQVMVVAVTEHLVE